MSKELVEKGGQTALSIGGPAPGINILRPRTEFSVPFSNCKRVRGDGLASAGVLLVPGCQNNIGLTTVHHLNLYPNTTAGSSGLVNRSSLLAPYILKDTEL